MTSRPLILVVDDESKIRRIVSMSLEAAGFDVCAADNGKAALAVFAATTPAPDLVVLDAMMPEMDGFSFLAALRKRSDVPVILLTARDRIADKSAAFALGADDYIVKPFAMQELLDRIGAVLRRCAGRAGAAGQAPALENGPLRLWPQKRLCRYGQTAIPLADTEFRLLAALMRHPGTMMTHEELIGKVWGPEFVGERNYLRVAFTRIRKKLAAAGLDGSVISAYSGVGYILEDLSEGESF